MYGTSCCIYGRNQFSGAWPVVFFQFGDWIAWIAHLQKQERRESLTIGMINLLIGGFILGFHWKWEGIALVLTVSVFLPRIKAQLICFFPVSSQGVGMAGAALPRDIAFCEHRVHCCCGRVFLRMVAAGRSCVCLITPICRLRYATISSARAGYFREAHAYAAGTLDFNQAATAEINILQSGMNG